MLTGDSYFDSKDFKNILESYENSIREGHPIFLDANDLTDIADYYNLTGNREEADRIIEYALQLAPSATLPLVYKARVALASGNYEKAKDYADRIEDKDDPDYKYLIAEILIAQRKIVEAEITLKGYYDEIEQEEHEDFVLDVTNLYLDYGISDMAFEWMCKCRIKNDEFKELMARTLFGLERYEESAKLFDELIDSDPYSKRHWKALAASQFLCNKYHDAITSCDYAIAIDPDDPECLLTKANALYRLYNYEGALEIYKKYCEKATNDELGLLNIAMCLISLERVQEAITYLEKACEAADPMSEHIEAIYREFAFAYSSLKMTDKALEYLEKSGTEDCDQAELMVLKGHILLENGRTEEAEKMYKEAILLSGKSQKTMLRIVVSLYDNKRLQQAYKIFKEIQDNNEGELDEGYSYMALCCLELKLTEEFLKYLVIATKKNRQEAKRVLGHLFPETMEPEDYYNDIIRRINIKE